jgi:hypothetical protein
MQPDKGVLELLMSHRKRLTLVAALAALMLLSACGPEAARGRGEGPGADIGNRGVVVDMHGPTNPAYQEPIDAKAVPTAGAQTR